MVRCERTVLLRFTVPTMRIFTVESIQVAALLSMDRTVYTSMAALTKNL
jgi:hypothetical protein